MVISLEKMALANLVLMGVTAGALPAQTPAAAPQFQFAADWPKPLPNRWVLGTLGGLCIDSQDHVLILNRQDASEATLAGGVQAPPIIEFDVAGNVVNSWGDPNLLENIPRIHSCHFDIDGNVWIVSASSGMVQKYSHDGRRLLQQIGQKGVFDTSNGTPGGTPLNSPAGRFLTPASLYADPGNGDIYVADGEGTNSNQRIVVMNRDGAFLRHWQPEGMESVHCMTVSNDGVVYVCNRTGSRVQLYDKHGIFKRNIDVPWTITAISPPGTPPQQNGGSAVAIAFSPDQNQRLMYVINQNNSRIEIIERETGSRLGSFGQGGSDVGQLNQPHGIAVDSKGNVYIADQRGRRIQKFTISQSERGGGF